MTDDTKPDLQVAVVDLIADRRRLAPIADELTAVLRRRNLDAPDLLVASALFQAGLLLEVSNFDRTSALLNLHSFGELLVSFQAHMVREHLKADAVPSSSRSH